MNLQERADFYADKYGIPRNIYRNIIQQESGWNPEAVSPKGAVGLAQAMPGTARDPGFGVAPLSNPYDPEESLRFGAEYYSAMRNKYGGDDAKALAAYNWGAGNLDKFGLEAAPEETRNYIASITGGQLPQSGGSTLHVSTMNGSPEKPSFGHVQDRLYPEETYDDTGFFAKMMPKMSDQQRRDTLLAIGAGLLSSNGLGEGLANAAEGILSVRGNYRDMDAKQAKFDYERYSDERGWELRERQIKNASESDFQRVGSVLDPATQEIVGGAAFDPKTAEYFRLDPQGNRVVIPGAIPLNNSTAAGDKLVTGPQIAKTQEEVRTLQGGLRSIERIMPHLSDMAYGAPGLVQELQTRIKTLSGSVNLSPEEIMRKATQGEIQGLIGAAKDEVVGPGVMTEQDALRILATLGGDAQSIFSNPEVATELLSRKYQSMSRNLGLVHDQYDAFRNIPGSVYIPIDRFQPSIKFDENGKFIPSQPQVEKPGALSSENVKQSGTAFGDPEAVDPEVWSKIQAQGITKQGFLSLTPQEQQELFEIFMNQ